MREVCAGRARATPRPRSRATSTSIACVRGIAGMAAAMDGLDALVFTGGVGERGAASAPPARGGLGFLGVAIDDAANAAATPDAEVSAGGAPVRILVVRAREDLEMARQVRAVLAADGRRPASRAARPSRPTRAVALARPDPVAHLGHVVAVLARVARGGAAARRPSAGAAPAARAPSPGTRSMTSITRWKRSRSLSMTMSNGVVVVPSSL